MATIDLGKIKSIEKISTNFLRDKGAWIFHPTEVEYLVSNDGQNFKSIGKKILDTKPKNYDIAIEIIEMKVPKSKYRYVKVIAKKLDNLPEWHIGNPMNGKSWIFVDEISVK